VRERSQRRFGRTFEGLSFHKLWFKDIHRWRQVEGNIENVCDLLDIAKGHEPPPPLFPPGDHPGR